MKKFLFTPTLLLFFCTMISYAQLPVSLELPRSSPKESRSITIGYTTITLEYSSVGIKDREIWGGLVPFDRVWRTGANENTLFTVTDDVLINGEELKAGTYGMHTIPGEEEWVIIFSNFNEAWGSFFYDESEDALRITVPAEEMDSKYEWMKFSFSDYTSNSVEISLKWAHRKIPFIVEIPMETTFAHIEKQFRTLPAFGWQGWVQGATYTLNNDYRTDKGLEWAERAAQRERNVQTLGLLGKMYVVNGDQEKGLEAAEELTSTWTDNWRSHYSAAEIYEEANDIERARSAYLKAADMADERSARVLRQRAEDLEE
ncbi:MAG: DUF2911 domain-containing protein [Balneola sp.]|nr:MAG: DUF2911 domain-containing protein [Balneola sp.]